MAERERPTIRVVAAFTTDPDGRILMVRKRGSNIFMQPGGKPEAGEDPVSALVRELAEELQVEVDPDELTSWGRFESDAANEPDHHLVTEVFALRLGADVSAAAEIAEAWEPIFFVPEKAASVWGESLAAGKAKRDPALGELQVLTGVPVAIGEDVDGLL